MPQPTDPIHHESVREHGAVVVPVAAAAERRRRNKALEDFRHIEDLTEAMADEPDGHANFTFLGNLRFIEGEYEDAIRSYSRALSLAPDDLSARAGRARARSEIFDLDLALADFDRALELAPDDANLHYGRGHCLSQLIVGEQEEQKVCGGEREGGASLHFGSWTKPLARQHRFARRDGSPMSLAHGEAVRESVS